MAELNFPTLTPENTKPVEENLTGTGTTVTTPEPVIETPVETQVIKEPVIQETPVIETPVTEAPVVETPVTPQVAETVVTPEVKVDVPKAETPKATKVETVQDIETKTIQNESADIKLQEEKRNKTIAETTALVQNGATIDEIVKFGAKNPDNRDAINATLKGAFKNASNLEYFGKYSTLNNDDLYAEYQLGNVVPGSDRYNLLPAEKKASFDAFLKQKEAANITEKTDYTATNAATDFTDLQSQISKMFSSSVRQNYEKALNSPKLNELNAKAANKQLELDKLDIEMETLQEDMEKQLAGNLTGSIRAEVRQEYNDKIREKRLKLAEYNSFASQINSIKSQAETELKLSQYEDGLAREEYQTALGLYETRRQEARADMSAEQKALAERENMIFQAKNKALAEDTQFQRDIALLEYKAQLSDKGVTGEWEERDDGMYFLKSDGTADKVLDKVTTPGLTTTTVFENGQAYTEVYDINNLGVGFTSQNTSLQASERELLNAPNGTRIPTRLGKDQLSPNNPGGKECGEYVNDIMARTVGQKIGSTWQDKLNYANETTGGVGSVAVWKVNPNVEDKYGHTGVIVGETSDGSEWIIKSSNIEGQGIVSTGRVPKYAVNGYRSTNVIGRQDTVGQFDQTSIPQFSNYLTTGKVGGTDAQLKSIESQFGSVKEFKRQAELYNNSENGPRQKELDKVVKLRDSIENILSEDNTEALSNSVGTIQFALLPGVSREKEDFLGEVQNLLDGLTLQTLIDAKSEGATFGALSNEELRMLQNTASSLNQIAERDKDTNNITGFKGSEKNFKSKVQKMVDTYTSIIDKKEKQIGKELSSQAVLKDESGKNYSKEEVINFIADKFESGQWTQEDVKFFMEKNNLTNKLQ